MIRTYEEARVVEDALRDAIDKLQRQEATEANKRDQRMTRALVSIAKRLHQVAHRKCVELGPQKGAALAEPA